MLLIDGSLAAAPSSQARPILSRYYRKNNAAAPLFRAAQTPAAACAERDCKAAPESRHHSGLIPASLITAPQRAVSVLMKAAASAGEPPPGVMLSCRKRASKSGSCSALLAAALSLATMASGVFGGAVSACQVSDSQPEHAGFLQRRDVRQRRDALFDGDRENSGAARLVQLDRSGKLVEKQIDIAGEDIVNRRRGAFVGHMGHLGCR